MIRDRRVLMAPALLLALVGCEPHHEPRVAVRHVPSAARPAAYAITGVEPLSFPFGEDTLAPFVTADGNRGFLISWLDKRASSMNFSTFRGGRWFQPRTIATGKMLINRANFPSIAADHGSLYAQWIEQNGIGSVIRISRSSNGGGSWSTPITPHPSMTSQFGFVSMAIATDGNLNAAWLDGRGLPDGEEGAGDMQLHYASLTGEAPAAADTMLDPRVCDCCQTAMAITAEGPIVAYRDRSPSEIRDIAVVRRTASGWSAPKTLHADGWKLSGCPVNGPQLAASGPNVAVVWYSAADGKPRVQVAFSRNAGVTFSDPIRVDEQHAAGHVGVALLADGSVIVTWVEQRAG
ncbi:MAG: hypothetical protein ABI837_14650, partial [Acidobacteriota bacterium]